MAEFQVYLFQGMSRSITVQADDIAEAIETATVEGDFNVNASNNFDPDGEVRAMYVYNERGETVWVEGKSR